MYKDFVLNYDFLQTDVKISNLVQSKNIREPGWFDIFGGRHRLLKVLKGGIHT